MTTLNAPWKLVTDAGTPHVAGADGHAICWLQATGDHLPSEQQKRLVEQAPAFFELAQLIAADPGADPRLVARAEAVVATVWGEP